MIGTGYWSTGITVEYRPDAGWCASLEFLDDGFCNDRPDAGAVATQGTLCTRYFVRDGKRPGLSAALDTLIADAGRLDISFAAFEGWTGCRPMIYYRQDGEDADCPPPDGWLALLAAEAERLGWATYERAAGAT